jgi:hypothetical protein
MAQQKFGNSFREALWETHGKKCFHCSRELLFVDMRVDHIVPEHLHHGETESRLAVLTEIGVPPDFNILGRENLAPSCGKCNGEKSGSVLIGRSTAVSLTRIERSLPALQANLQKRRDGKILDDTLRSVARSVDSGLFTHEQFLEQYRKLVTNDEGDGLVFWNLEVGKIYNKIKSPGFTEHARRSMEARGLMESDIAEAFWDNLKEGTVTAAKVPGQGNQYVVQGTNLRIVFAVFSTVIVVLTLSHSD